MPWGDMVEMQRLAHEAATESRQRRAESKRKAEEEEAAKRLAEAEAKRQEREEARQKAEEQEKMELALAGARRLRETEAAIQAEFQPRFEAELQARESRRKEEEEQRKKEEEDKRAGKAKGKESKGGKGGKGCSNARSPSSMANLQKREAMKIKDLLQTQEKNQAEIQILRTMLVESTMQVQDRCLVRIFSKLTQPYLFPCLFTQICCFTSRSYECFQSFQCGVLNQMSLSRTRT